MDTLGCGLEALEYPACTKLLGPIVPGTVVPHGARVPGTTIELDPVQAAFNIGAMIRWLDFNDTWLAAEWGHPSDNLGGILATADWLVAHGDADGQPPLMMRDVLTAMIKAHEIQGCIALENSFNKVGLDHVVLVKVASTAVVSAVIGAEPRADDRRAFAGMGGWAEPAHLSARAEYWIAQKLGSGRCHQPGGAAGADGEGGRDGLPVGVDRKDLGILRCFVPAGRSSSFSGRYGSYVMENVLFKISYPAEFHAQTAVEARWRCTGGSENGGRRRRHSHDSDAHAGGVPAHHR